MKCNVPLGQLYRVIYVSSPRHLYFLVWGNCATQPKTALTHSYKKNCTLCNSCKHAFTSWDVGSSHPKTSCQWQLFRVFSYFWQFQCSPPSVGGEMWTYTFLLINIIENKKDLEDGGSSCLNDGGTVNLTNIFLNA